MKRIISARKTAYPGSSLEEFFRGNDITVKRKISKIVNDDPTASFDLLIDEDGRKSIKKSGDLLGETINIIDDQTIAEFTDNGIIITDVVKESLPNQHTVDQWKKLRKLTKGIDIGDRISDMNKQGANIQYIQNPIDSGIESFQDFEKSNKEFLPNLNLKHLRPFQSHPLPQIKSKNYGDRSVKFNKKTKKK